MVFIASSSSSSRRSEGTLGSKTEVYLVSSIWQDAMPLVSGVFHVDGLQLSGVGF